MAEIFGPVLTVLTFRDETEAVAIANSSEHGLTAGIFTSDVTRAHRIARELEAGYVWINGSSRHYWGLPFDGAKESGVDGAEKQQVEPSSPGLYSPGFTGRLRRTSKDRAGERRIED
ncbi:aldehyde dehydrogenase family protein [Amycolatopsis sp. NPDC023774]|uniref:aldehyde dehydrogenase family protein n=1 Tax=Amycolatopsis sp. NPDC023774 TaxID=3155015 RepID=UPI0034042D05